MKKIDAGSALSYLITGISIGIAFTIFIISIGHCHE